MAVHDSSYYEDKAIVALTAPASPRNAPGGKDGSKLRVVYALVNGGDQVLAQDDFVNLFNLPPNALPMFYKLVWGAFGASVTLDVGDITDNAAATVDENKFESGLDVSSAGSLNWTVVDDSAPNAAPTVVRAHFEGANPADDQDLEVWLIYAELN